MSDVQDFSGGGFFQRIIPPTFNSSTYPLLSDTLASDTDQERRQLCTLTHLRTFFNIPPFAHKFTLHQHNTKALALAPASSQDHKHHQHNQTQCSGRDFADSYDAEERQIAAATTRLQLPCARMRIHTLQDVFLGGTGSSYDDLIGIDKGLIRASLNVTLIDMGKLNNDRSYSQRSLAFTA
jgi:hypothetical protein